MRMRCSFHIYLHQMKYFNRNKCETLNFQIQFFGQFLLLGEERRLVCLPISSLTNNDIIRTH
jgi:hypothetical protein